MGRVVARWRHGSEVISVADGEAAWEAFEKTGPPIDIVPNDLAMPGLDGVQPGERISNGGCHVPMIPTTAFATTPDPEQFQRAGFASLVTKPPEVDALLAILDRVRRRRN